MLRVVIPVRLPRGLQPVLKGGSLKRAQEPMHTKDVDAYLVLAHFDHINSFGENRYQPRTTVPAENRRSAHGLAPRAPGVSLIVHTTAHSRP